jgi:hypothetical protein
MEAPFRSLRADEMLMDRLIPKEQKRPALYRVPPRHKQAGIHGRRVRNRADDKGL